MFRRLVVLVCVNLPGGLRMNMVCLQAEAMPALQLSAIARPDWVSAAARALGIVVAFRESGFRGGSV